MPAKLSAAITRELPALVAPLERSAPEIGRAIADEIWGEIPTYSRLRDASIKLQVEEAAERNVAAFIRALKETKELSPREIDALGKVGAERAHQGVPLEDVLKAFRVVGRVIWDHLSVQISRRTPPRTDLLIHLGGTLMRFTDDISSAVARHYSTAQRSIVRQQEASRREFLHDLLLGSYSSLDSMVDRSRNFGFDLTRPHIAVVASGPAADAGAEEVAFSRALEAVAEQTSSIGQPLVDRHGGQTLGIISIEQGADADKLSASIAESLGSGWRIGIGGSYSGLDGCRRSYLEAMEALQVGQIVKPGMTTYRFDDFLLYRFLRTDTELVDRFVYSVIGGIIDYDVRRRGDLVRTLEMYFAADESAKEAGRLLYAHPHTVTYRLRLIERLTERSLKDPEDKLHLHLAIKAFRLQQGMAPAAGSHPEQAPTDLVS